MLVHVLALDLSGYDNSKSINILVNFFFQVIAEYLQKLDQKSDGAKRDWVAIYDECANVLYQVLIFFIALTFYHWLVSQ